MQRGKYAEDKRADEWERKVNNLKAAELKVWQEEDETLKEVWRAADGMVTMTGDGFFQRDGVIYRRWMPKEGIVTGEEVHTNVVYPCCALATAMFWLRHCVELNPFFGAIGAKSCFIHCL